MTTLTINSHSELKSLINSNRANITAINDISFNERYPMLEVSNKHASYYDVQSQGNKYINAPFSVTVK